MQISNIKAKYKDSRDLSVQLEYICACGRVEGHELISVSLENEAESSRFKNSASKILKSMKRDGVIKLFVFESELTDIDKMETVYLLNKYPELSEREVSSINKVYIKL